MNEEKKAETFLDKIEATIEEKFEAMKKALNDLLCAHRGGGDLGPAIKEAQSHLDHVEKIPTTAPEAPAADAVSDPKLAEAEAGQDAEKQDEAGTTEGAAEAEGKAAE